MASNSDDESWSEAFATALAARLPLPALVADKLQQAFAPESGPRATTLRCAPAAARPPPCGQADATAGPRWS